MSKGAAGQEGLTPQGLAGWGLSPQADMGRPGFPKLAGFVYMSLSRQSRHRIRSHHALKALGLLHYLLQKE